MHVQGTDAGQVDVRVVVTAEDADGRAHIARDSRAEHVVLTPLFNSVDIWQADAVPAAIADDSTLGELSLEPPVGGVVVRFVTIPPDAGALASGVDTAAALGAIGGADSATDGETHGLHKTDTIDVITVIAGELYAVLDEGETLLRAGDTLVQRGTNHAWSNRTDEPATFLATMYSAKR